MTAKAVAPWVRTRLRTAPGAAGALALLVLLTAFLAAALPRGVDRYEDRGLRHAVASAAPDNSVIRLSGPMPLGGDPSAPPLGPQAMEQAYQEQLKAIPAPLRADSGQSAYGVRTTEKIPAGNPLDAWLPRPEGMAPRLLVASRSSLSDHARLVSGRLPTAKADATSHTAEAVVTATTAKALHITPGSVVHVPGAEGKPLAIRITGLVQPLLPNGSYWASEPALRDPQLVPASPKPDEPHYWYAGLILGADSAPVLLGAAGSPEVYADIAPATDAMNARRLHGLSTSVASLEGGPALAALRLEVGPGTTVSTELDAILEEYTSVRDSITPVVAVATFGTATVAGVVLLMAGGLAAARRGTELALLRARGGSLPGIGGRLAAETAVVTVPSAALGLGLAVLVVRGGRLVPALLAVATVALVSCLALPVRAMAAHRTVRTASDRDDLVRVRPSRRRTVAELTLLVLAVGAVVALRRRSTAAGSDTLVSSAPVLVGVIAALVLVRLYPLPLRWAARPAARLRSTVGFLSLARAGRAPGGGVLPLLALLTALTTAAFGGSVLAGVADARDRAALYSTGADARVDSVTPLPRGLADRVAKIDGVSQVVAAHVEYGVEMPYGDRVAVIGADPSPYADLTDRTGLGAIGADELKARPGGKALAAIASPKVAAGLGRGPREVRVAGYRVTVQVVGVRERTPAVPRSDFLLVDTAGLGAREATTLLVAGTGLDRDDLRRTVTTPRTAGERPTVQLRTETRHKLVDSPLQSGAERVYGAAVAAGAGYAVLALLLSLLRGAPERSALLARLRTMGLTRRQGRRLLILEALPQAVLAALGGALTGWAATELLSPGVDLTGLALAASPQTASAGSGLRPDAMSLLIPAVCVVALAAGVAATQAWWTSRRGSVTELRAGDTR
ncbi:FtsX-like permease family protein [Streptomyces melanogenes]|uniref:ABC transporter permease n=1 Tax=Streptomyces melanogenes TaxID=67326 RepID=A0ABZ1XJY2_9ACTN|nr:FtsX-like permease family protein [Streptomyces melanogenes]